MARKADINIGIGADLSEFSTAMQNVSRKMKRFGKKFERLGKKLTRSVTLPLLAIAAASIKFSSDLTEAINKADVAFGDASKSVQEFAKTTLRAFGIAEVTALDMAANFGDMATSMGVARAQAAKMSTVLVGVAGDMASFKNVSIERAQTALDAVFTGETETLKKLGIVMTVVELNAFALSKGITKTVNAMTGAEKVNLRYQFILDRTSNSQGDFVRTGGNAANQMRIFQETLKELATEFGQVILPTFTRFLKKLNAFLLRLRDINPQAKKLIVIIAGIAAAIGPLIFMLGLFAKAIAIVTVANLALAASIASIVSGIAVLGAAILIITKNWQAFVEEIRVGNAKILNAFIDMGKKIVPIMLKIFAPFLPTKFADSVGEALEGLKKDIPTTVKQFKGFKQVLNEILVDMGLLEIKRKKLRGDAKDGTVLAGGIVPGASASTKFDKKAAKQRAEEFSFLDKLVTKSNAVLDAIAPLDPVSRSVATGLETMAEANKKNADAMKEATRDAKRYATELKDGVAPAAEETEQSIKGMAQSLLSAFAQVTGDTLIGFADRLGQAIGGVEGAFDNIGSSLLSGLADFMQDLGKMLIQMALAEVAFAILMKTAGTGIGVPAALAAGAALIAIGAGIKAAMQSAGSQGFFQGGIVQGAPGRDQVPIMATAGELILNRAQQSNIAGQLGGMGGGVLTTMLKGTDIEISLDRTRRNNQRRR